MKDSKDHEKENGIEKLKKGAHVFNTNGADTRIKMTQRKHARQLL